MFRIASHNINGIRAAHKRGWSQWLEQADIDVICLQEVRAVESQYPEGVFDGYYSVFDTGELKGRNGVAILSRLAPLDVRTGIGLEEFEADGRYVEVDLAVGETSLTVGSLYLPKGATESVDKEKYDRKFRFLHALTELLNKRAASANKAGGHFLITGDFNIARSELDIKNWKGNVKNEGFLPEERDWFDNTLNSSGLIDVVRHQHGDTDGPYSWWSWRGKAFDNDSGWRIDYHLATPDLAATATKSWVHREAAYDKRMSDHSPVIVDYDL